MRKKHFLIFLGFRSTPYGSRNGGKTSIYVSRIIWSFESDQKIIKGEVLIYQFKFLVAWIGGAYELYIKPSLFDILKQSIDLIFNYVSNLMSNVTKL